MYVSRSRMSHVLSCVSLAAIVVSIVGVVLNTSLVHAASLAGPGYSASKGTLARVATVDPTKLPTKAPPASKKTLLIRHHSPGQQVTNGALLIPTATGISFAGKGSLLQNFNGLSSLDNRKVNGFDLEPPDQGLCVGNGFVMEAINIVGAVYHTNGKLIRGPFGLQAFFAETPGITGTFISDPRCYFDASTHTWFATILAIPSPGGPPGSQLKTRVDLAVNSSGNPTTPWTIYKIDTTDLGNPGCPCLPDQPIMGIDQDNVYITTNEFPLFSPGFNGAQIYALSKSQLVSLSNPVKFVHFGNLTTGGFPVYHLEPAITNGNAAAEYLMNSLGPFDNLDNRLGLWAITNQQAVTEGGMPTLSAITITSETYVAPGIAPNPNGNSLNPDDDGLLQLQYINGNLWTSLNTSLLISGDRGSRDGAAWFEVHPKLSSNGRTISSASIRNQGYVALKGKYLLYSAIATGADGTAVMAFTVTGASTFPSAGYAVLRAGAKSFGAVHIAASGTTTDNGFSCGGALNPCRWGDYSAAVIDPSSTNAWLATEYIPPIGSTMANWGTRLFEVQA